MGYNFRESVGVAIEQKLTRQGGPTGTRRGTSGPTYLLTPLAPAVCVSWR